MNNNPYAPPQAEVADVSHSSEGDGTTPTFYPCSLLKVGLLSVCTLGLYQIFWFYKNWCLEKDRTGENIMPVWRSIFGVFFCYDLFKRIRAYQHKEQRNELPAGMYATIWIICNFAYRLPGLLFWLGFLSVAPVVLVQAEINAINAADAPGHDPNTRFTVWNWIIVLVGIGIVTLAIIGSMETGE